MKKMKWMIWKFWIVSKVAKFGMPDPEFRKLPSLIRRGGRRFGGPGGRRFRVPASAGREI